MKKLSLIYNYKEQKKSSTMLALAQSECDAAEFLIEKKLYKEAVVHLYFTCFYATQSLLVGKIKSNPSHNHLQMELHHVYGKSQYFPRRYVNLHSRLHTIRNEYDYRNSYSPDPEMMLKELRSVRSYLKFSFKFVPKLEIKDIILGIYNDNKNIIKDFSYDIYCPKTYSHHTRITFWQPPFYLPIFSHKQLSMVIKNALQKLRVKNYNNYVIGLNSKLNQYSDEHLLMLDIDSVNPAIEKILKSYGGILLKSGRGYHFIGTEIIKGEKEWHRLHRKISKSGILKKCVDKKHIEISLKRGYSTLRITANSIKPQIPFFYKEL